MDVTGRLAKELESRAPYIAQSIWWQKATAGDAAVRTVRYLLNRGDTSVDVGAALGLYTAGMLRAVGRGGRVFTFEPNPANLAMLRKMQRSRRQMVLKPMAVSETAGEATFMVPVVNGSKYTGMGSLEDPRSKMQADVDTFTVPVSTLDDALGGVIPALIKIDVEGHEDAVLAGASRTLAGQPTVLIELEQRHRGSDPTPTMQMLQDVYGLTGWAVFPDRLRPIAEFDLVEHQLRFLDREHGATMPEGYINDFVFTTRDVSRLTLPRSR
jgi:FkbM family methyltransferase